MNEFSKTGIFAGVAAVLALLAYVTETPTSSNIEDEARERVGEVLFPAFTDSLNVANLKIVKYDEKLGTHDQFEVAQDSQSGLWILPSHDSYPADAQDQMSKAANSLIGVKILALASSRNDDQAMYGVVEPAPEKTQVGASGVGYLVRMLDNKGERLADLVIGKKVAGSETQRYVRIPTNDQIYIAEIDPANFPTDFSQWIDKDLLQLSSTDIRTLDIRKYDIAIQGNSAGLVRQFDAVLNYNTEDGKWKPTKLVQFNRGVDTPRELTADEELNASKLNAMKTALDSMQIANVARKPEGLAANLKADEKLLQDQASMQSMQSKGFFVPQSQEGNEIYSSSGELLVSLKDGVQYLLRFGDTADTTLNSGADDAAETTTGEDKSFSLNRYLMVTARVDESQIPEAQLQPVPQTVEEMEALEAAEKAAQAPASAPTTTPDKSNVQAAPPTATAAPAASDEPNKDSSAASNSETQDSATQPEAATEPAPAESNPNTELNTEVDSSEASEPNTNPSADTPQPTPTDGSHQVTKPATRFVALQESSDDAAAQETSAGAAATAPPAAAGTNSSDATPAPAPDENNNGDNAETAEEKQERLQALQEKINKANQRKIDERNDRLEAAKKRVAELNARFAEWYYVISESQYEKLSVSLDDLIQNKNAASGPSLNQPPNGLPNFGGFGN